MKQNNSNFGNCELLPGIHTIKDISEAVYTMGDHEGTLQIEYCDISMRKKPNLTRFGGNFGTLRFDEKIFLKILLGFTPYWDYKPTNAIHADSPGVYTSDKILILSKIDKIHLKRDVIDGSVDNGLRQPLPFSFILDTPAGYKVLCEPETVQFKKINKSVLSNITNFLEDDNHKEIDFKGETLTFT